MLTAASNLPVVILGGMHALGRLTTWSVVGAALVGLTACSTIQQDADDEAVVVADQLLPQKLTRMLRRAGAESPQARLRAVDRWLRGDPTRSTLRDRASAGWRVVGSEGSVIRVDVYAYEESGSFFPPDQGEAAWGVACRAYDVAGRITTTAVECPEGTPETP